MQAVDHEVLNSCENIHLPFVQETPKQVVLQTVKTQIK